MYDGRSMTPANRITGIESLNRMPSRGVLIVTPTYNESGNVAAFMDAVAKVGCDLLIVDDASPDGTSDIVRSKAAAAPMPVFLMSRRGKLGLGTAYVDAYAWVLSTRPDYKVIVQMDVDFSHDPAMVPRLAEAAERCGVAIGSRYVTGGSAPDWPLRRRFLSRGANVYAKTLIHLRFGSFDIQDATAGFVAWRRDALEKVFGSPVMSNGYAFQIETKLRATFEGYVPQELPSSSATASMGCRR